MRQKQQSTVRQREDSIAKDLAFFIFVGDGRGMLSLYTSEHLFCRLIHTYTHLVYCGEMRANLVCECSRFIGTSREPRSQINPNTPLPLSCIREAACINQISSERRYEGNDVGQKRVPGCMWTVRVAGRYHDEVLREEREDGGTDNFCLFFNVPLGWWWTVLGCSRFGQCIECGFCEGSNLSRKY